MKDKTNISLAISIIAIFISLYSLKTNDNDKLFVEKLLKTKFLYLLMPRIVGTKISLTLKLS